MTASPSWIRDAALTPDARAAAEAAARQDRLTKPPGALGRLETLAVRLAGMQGRARPTLDRIAITVFAADHGVVAEGVSAFPQSVTGAMIANFLRGGAAISVAARSLGARLEVVDLGTAEVAALPDPAPGVRLHRQPLGPGTANFRRGEAMTAVQLGEALHVGREAVMRALADGADLFVGGEMGIGNTTAATALACLLTDASAEALCGPGTGLDDAGVQHKASVVRDALRRHAAAADDALAALRCVGGFEIAALCGAYVAAAQHGLPVLVDGFIATTAALAARRLCAGLDAWCFFGHASAEPGHAAVLRALDAEPLLDLGMRLGEGSGAAVAVPLLRMACTLHDGMATFDEARVADGS
ncbi:nicotinate-nucleotide--dimethylbenzimidazole phosphoribosyltransferase [Algiphilus sp.]|uniref:nicotinate-nucleotide--dimethylbenzimidazole phosphoribosyltransferase n=1 Tax=Algiphilus sp. TaxID=1872431 RepID=UPI003C57A2B1